VILFPAGVISVTFICIQHPFGWCLFRVSAAHLIEGHPMVWTQADHDRTTSDLRQLLAAGQSLGEALRELHHGRGLGQMWLYPAVEIVCGFTRTEAMRVVVRETFSR
jgi:hypothetical protein